MSVSRRKSTSGGSRLSGMSPSSRTSKADTVQPELNTKKQETSVPNSYLVNIRSIFKKSLQSRRFLLTCFVVALIMFLATLSLKLFIIAKKKQWEDRRRNGEILAGVQTVLISETFVFVIDQLYELLKNLLIPAACALFASRVNF